MLKVNLRESQSIVLHSLLDDHISIQNKNGWVLTRVENFSKNYYITSFVYLGRSVHLGLTNQQAIIDGIARAKINNDR